MIATAGSNRHGHRDATMILIAYSHGLRAIEGVTLRWDAVDFHHGDAVPVQRHSYGVLHPLTGRSCGSCADYSVSSPASPFVFVSERGAPFPRSASVG